jgi:hypothetical protein
MTSSALNLFCFKQDLQQEMLQIISQEVFISSFFLFS